jgi:hypothetical protein
VDKLAVVQKAEELGGKERRNALEQLMIAARTLGCTIDAGGGRIGGINFRFGSIGYAILDVSTTGDVKVYVQPHPNKTAPEALTTRLNEYVAQHPDLNLKTHPINCYGLLDTKVEAIPIEALSSFLETAVQAIRDTYYNT